jgi:predicted ester cyclase
MNNEECEGIVRRLLEAMDRGELSIIDTLCTADLKVHFMDQDLDVGRIKEAATAFNAAFPDLQHSIEELSVEGDRVTLRARDRATHRGIYRRIPPTGRSVEFETTATYRIANGKIAEIWQTMDLESLMQQLES